MAVLGWMQKMGRSLMIPIAVMPAASILYRLGEIESDNAIFSKLADIGSAGGNAILAHMPLLFAVGIAIGFTSGAGVAALSAVVGYLVFQDVLAQFNTEGVPGVNSERLDTGVLGGILTGFITAVLFNKYKDIQLPKALGFFGGRRFVPIVSAVVMVAVGAVIGLIWQPIQDAIRSAGMAVLSSGETGAGLFGLLNRLLIPTGLHHIVNNIAWQVLGDYTTDTGKLVHGDMNRYLAGDPNAGVFMSGFYPVMLFGLPAAGLAMARAVRDKNRKIVVPILLSASLTSFLTGITEPLEFSFLFAAPILYAVHALLTGLSMMIMYWLDVRLGFGFSAGLIDLLLNWRSNKDSLLMLLVGAAYFIVYYFLFTFMIRAFGLKTPGTDEEEGKPVEVRLSSERSQIQQKAEQIVEQLGGFANITDVDACITRLRVVLKDDSKPDDNRLRLHGALGVMRLGGGHVHLVYGTDSELLKEAMLSMMTHIRPQGNKPE